MEPAGENKQFSPFCHCLFALPFGRCERWNNAKNFPRIQIHATFPGFQLSLA